MSKSKINPFDVTDRHISSVKDMFRNIDEETNVEPQEVQVDLLKTFPNHPFSVKDDDAMGDLVDSISTQGVITPLVVRKVDDSYQVISGHRRIHAVKKLGLKTVPVLVKQVSDDEATIMMVDSNLQRPHIAVSELAHAYKQRYEALKHQGFKNGNGTARSIMAQQINTSESTVARLVKLADLPKKLLECVDSKRLGANVACRLTTLPTIVRNTINDLYAKDDDFKLSSNQLSAIEDYSKSNSTLDKDKISELANGDVKSSVQNVKKYVHIPSSWIPENVKESDVKEWVHTAIEQYLKSHQE